MNFKEFKISKKKMLSKKFMGYILKGFMVLNKTFSVYLNKKRF